jgi:hypothetical protein
MKTKLGISQFFINNTPNWAQITGDISLTLAAISAIILYAQTQLPTGVVMPHLLITISEWCVTGGSIVKFASKFFGVSDTTSTPVSQTTNQPK